MRAHSSLWWEYCGLASPGKTLVPVLGFYNPGVGSIFLRGMVVSVTHGTYCDARLQFCCQKYIGIVVYHLFYRTLHVPDVIISL